jgi:MFS family permease
MICGIAPLTAVTVYSLAGFPGPWRPAAARRAGRPHRRQAVLVGGLLVQALCIATYLAVAQLGEFYALSVVFGLAYGGVMPLYAVLVREFFGASIMGTVFGAVSAFASLGMALGPWAGGLVYDTTHSLHWLHAGSFAIGLAAVAVALSFPSKRRESPRSRPRCGMTVRLTDRLDRPRRMATIRPPAEQQSRKARGNP